MSAANSNFAGVRDWLDTLPQPLRALQTDSRRIEAGDVFVAIPGVEPGRSADGRTFLDSAAARGAVAAIVEADGWNHAIERGIPVLPVARLRSQLGAIAAAYYRYPSAGLRCIGVTGTNGKTSCSQWIAQLLTMAGSRCAVIGTLGAGFPGESFSETELTTPEPAVLQRRLREFADQGARAVAIEASSIGLEQGRLEAVNFSVGVFTNLTRDHLDYHGTMEHYEAAKQRLPVEEKGDLWRMTLSGS